VYDCIIYILYYILVSLEIIHKYRNKEVAILGI